MSTKNSCRKEGLSVGRLQSLTRRSSWSPYLIRKAGITQSGAEQRPLREFPRLCACLEAGPSSRDQNALCQLQGPVSPGLAFTAAGVEDNSPPPAELGSAAQPQTWAKDGQKDRVTRHELPGGYCCGNWKLLSRGPPGAELLQVDRMIPHQGVAKAAHVLADNLGRWHVGLKPAVLSVLKRKCPLGASFAKAMKKSTVVSLLKQRRHRKAHGLMQEREGSDEGPIRRGQLKLSQSN